MKNFITWTKVQSYRWSTVVFFLLGACDKAEIPSTGGGSSGAEVSTNSGLTSSDVKSGEAVALEERLVGNWRKDCEDFIAEDKKPYYRFSIYEFGADATIKITYFNYRKKSDCTKYRIYPDDTFSKDEAKGTYNVANQVRTQPVYSTFLAGQSNLETNWAKVNVTLGNHEITAFPETSLEFEIATVTPYSEETFFYDKLILISKGSFMELDGAIVLDGTNILTNIK